MERQEDKGKNKNQERNHVELCIGYKTNS